MNHQDLINRCERTADVQNAIATADHCARLAGLPTYSELAKALRDVNRLAIVSNTAERTQLREAVLLAHRIPT